MQSQAQFSFFDDLVAEEDDDDEEREGSEDAVESLDGAKQTTDYFEIQF